MRRIIAAGLTAAGVLLAGCTTQAASSTAPPQPRHTLPVGPPGVAASGILRLGMTGDLTDAPALVGWQAGYFGQALGNATLEPQLLPSAQAEATALIDGQLDAAYLDPVTALQVWQATHGTAITIIAGAASGGTELVVAPKITSPAQLRNRHLAAPAGTTQQAAADYWLRQQHLPALTTAEATASTSAGLLHDFSTGKIAGAWEPPPLNIQLAGAGGHVLLSESALWPHGQYPTAVLAVTRQFLKAHPAAVTALLEGQIQADRLLTTSPTAAAAAIAQRFAAAGTPLPPAVITRSLTQLTFTEDPLPSAMSTEAANAAAAGIIRPATSLATIYDLAPLNQLREAAGQPPIGT